MGKNEMIGNFFFFTNYRSSVNAYKRKGKNLKDLIESVERI